MIAANPLNLFCILPSLVKEDVIITSYRKIEHGVIITLSYLFQFATIKYDVITYTLELCF